MMRTGKIKIVIVGFGNMGKDWVPVLKKHKSIIIIGVVDVIEKNLEDAKKLLHLDNSCVGKDLEIMLGEKKPDAIINTTPPVFHTQVAKIALKHNCHVLGEKPISLSLTEAESIIQLCKKSKRIYMINQNYRWNPAVQKIKSAIDTDKVGKIDSILITYSQNFKFVDTFRYKIDHPFILDMAVHHYDLVRYCTKSNARTVYCVEHNINTSPFKNGSSATSIFRMESGVVFTYCGSWGEIGEVTSFMGTWKIAGNKGSITWDGGKSLQLQYLRNNKIKTLNPALSPKLNNQTKEAFEYELSSTLDQFVTAIKTGKQPETWCGDNLQTLKMVLASLDSAKKNELVKI